MIPLRDEERPRRFPLMTLLLVLANIAIFGYQMFYSSKPFDFYLRRFGFVSSSSKGELNLILTLFTSMFIHAGVFHLAGNMWFLWVFGGKIEDHLGKFRFMAFYLSIGCLAVLTHIAMHPGSKVPLVGASGAIAGLLGAYFLVFPLNRIVTLFPIFIFFTTVKIPAFVFLGLWFMMQVTQAKIGGSDVAWWAHVGGFVSGMLLIYPFLKNAS